MNKCANRLHFAPQCKTATTMQRRLEAIELCGLFGGWDHDDLMRLTKMSRVHRHTSKSILLMQRKVGFTDHLAPVRQAYVVNLVEFAPW